MMQSIYNSVKAATVAIAVMHPEGPDNAGRSHSIIGSGFCIHSDGIIVSCSHVIKPFYNTIIQLTKNNETIAHEMKDPLLQVIFFGKDIVNNHIQLTFLPIVDVFLSGDSCDLSVIKVKAYSDTGGYPTLEICDYKDIHEMMDVATCGFPLGSSLYDQIGTFTSSFTKGMISSIIPAPNVKKEFLKGFQLDMTATNGNSGGPVFCLKTGKVFGVLQGGVVHPGNGQPVQGLTKAEAIYPILESGLVDLLLAGPNK